MKPYYQSGGTTIYHGDCRELLPQLGGKVGLVLTDPPYAAGAAKREWRVTASVAVGLSESARLVNKGGAMLVFSTTSGRGIDFTLGAVGAALPFNRILVWHKEFVRSRVAGPWRWDTVAILGFGRCSFGRPQFSSMFTSKGPCSPAHLGEGKHPAELPPGIAGWLYEPFDAEGLTVLDPFCGTGQLLVPAARAGRNVIGMDVEERYCEMAAKRIEVALQQGQEAVSDPQTPQQAMVLEV